MTWVRETVRGMLARAVDWETGLDLLTVAPAAEVDRTLVTALRETTARLFALGWQPVELLRVVARYGEPAYGRLVTDAVGAYLTGFDRKRVDPRWLAQADEIGAKLWWSNEDAYLSEAAARWRLDRVALLDAAVGLLRALAGLPPIEVLVPPPGTRIPAKARTSDATRTAGRTRTGGATRTGAGTHAAGGARAGDGAPRVDERLLDRVRSLLAKAESTAFPAEAEAYSAKAQELIARHSIEEALAAEPAADIVPFARRVGVDHPYENEKAALLDAVARANHCETVWSPELGFTTAFGFDSDIDSVELLYTSLLVQANRAMAQSEPAGGRAGKARLKAFRRSFLVAYAVRIGERLEAAAGAALATAAAGNGHQDGADDPHGDPPGSAEGGVAGLLPVLASRDAQVRETMRRVFPNTVRARGSRVDSREGWNSGREAADRAALSRRTAVDR